MDHLDFKAIYGTFDQHMEPLSVFDVTNIVDHFFFSKKIRFPASTSFNQYFGDPDAGKGKFLQLKIGDRIYNIAEDSYTQDIEIDLNNNCDDENSNQSTTNLSDDNISSSNQTKSNESPLASLERMLAYPPTTIESPTLSINDNGLKKKKFDKYRLFAEKMLRSTLS